jgi:hypothetical protein
MTKEELEKKLNELGITTTNCYPKTSFLYEGVASIGCFPSELKSESFYFFNKFDSKIYEIPYNKDYKEVYKLDSSYSIKDKEIRKYIVPLSEARLIYEDVPFKQLPDKPFKEMTLREYACIHLKVPNSGLPWLDEIIKS